jgi:trk system potassium uptake protein TrkA
MMLVIVGGGTIAFYLARHGIARGHRVHMILKDKEEAETFTRKLDAVILLGDGTCPEVLAEAEVQRADAFISLYHDDWDNLIACQVAQTFFGITRTIPLVNDPENLPLFDLAGISPTVSAAEILGSIIEQESSLTLIATRLATAAGQVMVLEITLKPHSPAVGYTLQELNLPPDSLIAMIIRGGEFLVPRGSDRLAAEDELLLVCRLEAQDDALRALLGAQGG